MFTRVRSMRKIGVRQKSLLWAGLALFSLTLSAFVTSTIAWFNVSDFLTVGNIKVSCTNHDIRIGTRNSLGSIEFEADDMVSNDEQTYLTPVSSMFQDNSVYLNDRFPTLSSEYPSARGYREINLRGLRLVKNGGYLATCSCSHFMTQELFSQTIAQAARAAHKRLRQVEFRTQSPDHPILWAADESYYLKFFIFQVVEEM